MPFLPLHTRSGASLAAVGDPTRDRTVYATILLLVAIGFALIMLAVWLVRNTRPDPEVLAPLERMGERKWRRADPVWQRRRLDEVRPRGADPLEPSTAPPSTDAEFERGPQPIGFDDLAVSAAATSAVGSDLPAPSADALPVDGPTGDEGGEGDEGDEVGEAVPTGTDAAGADDDEPADGEEGGGDDDEEDITGEQDADDFFAVLEEFDEFDALPDVDTEAAEEREVMADDERADVDVLADDEDEFGPAPDLADAGGADVDDPAVDGRDVDDKAVGPG